MIDTQEHTDKGVKMGTKTNEQMMYGALVVAREVLQAGGGGNVRPGANCHLSTPLALQPYHPESKVHLQQTGHALRVRFSSPSTREHTLVKAEVNAHDDMAKLAAAWSNYFAENGTPVTAPPVVTPMTASAEASIEDDEDDEDEELDDDDNGSSVW